MPREDAILRGSGDSRSSGVQRGEPDGQADSFLRQKEAQLREKREREKRDREQQNKKTESDKRVDPSPVANKVSSSSDSLLHKDTGSLGRLDQHGSSKKKDNISGSNALQQNVPQDKSHIVQDSSKSKSELTSNQSNKQSSVLQNRTNNNKNVQQQSQIKNDKLPQKDKTVLHTKKLNQHIGKDLSTHIPKFYFPLGQPPSGTSENDAVVQRVREAFGKIENGKASRQQMAEVAKVISDLHSFLNTTNI